MKRGKTDVKSFSGSNYRMNKRKSVVFPRQYRNCFSRRIIALLPRNNKKRSHTQLDSRKQVIAFQDRVITINKGSSTPTKMRKTSNRQIQYNVENFDKIHASSASVRNWSSQ